jgi:protein gp37
MSRSSIEWLARPGTIPESWNPVTGCTPVSLACEHCYAARMAKRLKAMGQPKYQNGFDVTLHPQELETPYRWRKPRTVFVCSMSDLFHGAVPSEFIAEVFDVMDRFRAHLFIVLTKRAKRMASWRFRGGWPPNIWAGVTVEEPDYLFRLDHLRRVPASVRFVSLEPLLGEWPVVALPFYGIHWVIAGAETGPHRRPMDERSAMWIVSNTIAHDIPFFFKRNNDGSRLLGGRMHEGWPR